MATVDYSLAALVRHCDLMAVAGHLSKSKNKGLKTACRSVISGLAPELQADVRNIDVNAAISSYSCNNPEAAKKTLSEYRSRLREALSLFNQQSETHEDQLSQTEPISPGKKLEQSGTVAFEIPLTKSKTTSSHTLNIPLRPDFVAQLLIPYDIRHVEVRRISKMLEVLAMDNDELDS